MTDHRYAYTPEQRRLAEWGHHTAPQRIYECPECGGESRQPQRCEHCDREIGGGE